MLGTNPSLRVTRERLQYSILSFLMYLRLPLVLSRIDRIFINLHMAEARDSHCSSHVVENLGKNYSE